MCILTIFYTLSTLTIDPIKKWSQVCKILKLVDKGSTSFTAVLQRSVYHTKTTE